MSDGETDNCFIRFWPLSEIIPARELFHSAEYSGYENDFGFADYSIWVHGYAFELTPQPSTSRVAIIGGQSPTTVAPSLQEFLESYLADSDGVGCPPNESSPNSQVLVAPLRLKNLLRGQVEQTAVGAVKSGSDRASQPSTTAAPRARAVQGCGRARESERRSDSANLRARPHPGAFHQPCQTPAA
jgi:hypothetical protein